MTAMLDKFVTYHDKIIPRYFNHLTGPEGLYDTNTNHSSCTL